MGKKHPLEKDLWTKWFFPFTLYFPAIWRKKFPHYRPGPEKLKKYRNINNGLTVLFVGIGWTAFGYVFSRYKKYDEPDTVYKEDGTIDKDASRVLHAPRRYVEGKEIEIASWSWSEGYKKIDATEAVRKIVVKDQFDKYNDADYLANRANMKKDDPKFDKDFWMLYFKKVDAKRNRDLNEEFAKRLSID